MYNILLKISPVPSLTSKFLHRYFILFISPHKNCTTSKNEHLVIDKNDIIHTLNGLSSSFVSSFYVSWLKHGEKLKQFCWMAVMA